MPARRVLLTAGPGHSRRLAKHGTRLVKLVDVHEGHAEIGSSCNRLGSFAGRSEGAASSGVAQRCVVSGQRPLPGRTELLGGRVTSVRA